MTQTTSLPVDNPDTTTLPVDRKPIAPPKRRLWLKVLLVLAIFLFGMIAGAGLTVIVAVKQIKYAVAHPEIVPDRAAARLKKELDLSDDQTAKVRAIIAERQAAFQAQRRQFQPHVDEQLTLLRSQVKQVLNETQAAKWDIFLDEVISKWIPRPPATSPATQPK